jgi:hypothetical protein
MPKIYWVQSDEAISAESPSDLVTKLTNSSMMPVEDEKAFRDRAAMWCKELYKADIRTDTDDNFVADMIACGAYRVEEAN